MENRLNNNQNVLSVMYATRFEQESFDRNTVESVFVSRGLDTKYLPKISKKTDAKRSIHDYYKKNRGKGSIINSVEETKEQITMQINAAEVFKTSIIDANSGDQLIVSQKTFDNQDTITVIYDCVNDSFVADNIQVIERLKDCLNIRRATYPRNTIKDSLIQILMDKTNAMKVADGMDLLNVPSTGLKILENVENTIRDLDPMASITHYEIAKTVANQQQISNSVMEKMESFNNGIKERIEKFVAESAKMSTNQKKAFINEVESQYKFLESYKTVLEEQYEKAIQNLDATRDLVNNYYTDGKIVNPYQKRVDSVIEALGDDTATIVKVVKQLQSNDEGYKSVELPDEISELLAEAE